MSSAASVVHTDAVLRRESEDVRVRMAASPFWSKVRLARQQLIRKFNWAWDPNETLPKYEKWVYMMAIQVASVDIEGAGPVTSQVFEMEPELAAQSVAHGTHRLARLEEIEKFLSDRKAREQYCRDASERERPELAAYRASVAATEQLSRAADALGKNAEVILAQRHEASPAENVGKDASERGNQGKNKG